MVKVKVKKKLGKSEAAAAQDGPKKAKRKAARPDASAGSGQEGIEEAAAVAAAEESTMAVSSKKRLKKKKKATSAPTAEQEEPAAEQTQLPKKRKKLREAAEAQAEVAEATVKRKKRSSAVDAEAADSSAAGPAEEEAKEKSGKEKKKKKLKGGGAAKGEESKDKHESDDDSFFGGEKQEAEEEEEGEEAAWREPGKFIDNFKVWVGDLPWSCSEGAVRADFAQFGEILRFDMPKNNKGLPDGVAYIYYASNTALKKALTLDGTDYYGKTIRVKRATKQDTEKKAEGTGKNKEDLTLFVGGLPFRMEQEELEKSFGECGEIESVRMLRGPNGYFKGIAFIVFKTLKAVRKALLRDGEDCEGRTLQVSKPIEKYGGEGGKGAGDKGKGKGKDKGKDKGKGKGKDQNQTELTVFVGSLPPDTAMEKIKSDFEECGPIEIVRMVKGPDGKFRGAAFIVFKTLPGAKKALDLDGKFFYGTRPIKVAPAFSKEQKKPREEDED